MSLAELKRGAANLSESERRQLLAFLLQLGRARNPIWREEMSRRMARMDEGHKVSQAEFEQQLKN